MMGLIDSSSKSLTKSRRASPTRTSGKKSRLPMITPSVVEGLSAMSVVVYPSGWTVTRTNSRGRLVKNDGGVVYAGLQKSYAMSQPNNFAVVLKYWHGGAPRRALASGWRTYV